LPVKHNCQRTAVTTGRDWNCLLTSNMSLSHCVRVLLLCFL